MVSEVTKEQFSEFHVYIVVKKAFNRDGPKLNWDCEDPYH